MDLPLPMKSRRALWVRSVAWSWEQACAQLLPAMAMDNEVDCLGNRAVTANGELKAVVSGHGACGLAGRDDCQYKIQNRARSLVPKDKDLIAWLESGAGFMVE